MTTIPRPKTPQGLETPGLTWRERKASWIGYWVARADIVKRGYEVKSVRLWPPSDGAYREPDETEWKAIASRCDKLQAEMLFWGKSKVGEWKAEAVYDRTFKSALRIYQEDPDSPYQNLRHATKKSYDSRLRTLIKAVGNAVIPALTFRDFRRWHEKFSAPKIGSVRPRTARGHAMMTQVRLILSFCSLLTLDGCKAARDVLEGMTFTMPRKRTTVITAAQVIAHRKQSHLDGYPSIALAQAMMFELTMRPKDVVGEWIPLSEPGLSDITVGDLKWLHGARWEEVSPDLIWTKRISKSLRGRDAVMNPDAGKEMSFDLKAYPMIVEELAHVALEDRRGPIIKCEYNGLPWRNKQFPAKWRKIAQAAGIPDHVQNRDSRAGGISEGRKAGARLEDMRHHAGHSQLSTTAGYDRSDVEDKNKVAELRARNRPKT